MAPYKVDQLEINPSLLGSRLIGSTSNGDLLFTDNQNPTGLSLSQLAGLQLVGHMLVVGSGAGSAYATIQEALDAVPIDSSATNPYFIFVGPGIYRETVNIVRDGVYITGFGATLQSAAEATPNAPSAYHTIVIQAALGTVPKNVVVNNLRITNSHANYACVRIVGASGSEVGLGGIWFNNCSFGSTGNGRPISATLANRIRVCNGSMMESTTAALVYIDQCADVLFENVLNVPNIAMGFDSTAVLPAVVVNDYRLIGCSELGYGSLSPQVQVNLIGGHLTISGCTGQANTLLTGNSPVSISGSIVGNLTLTGALAIKLISCSRGAVASSGGATLAEPITRGSVSFAGSATASITFTTAQPDSSYSIGLEVDATLGGDSWFVSGKSGSGFTINFGSPKTLNGVWTTNRVM
jgi:hypothetical protein